MNRRGFLASVGIGAVAAATAAFAAQPKAAAGTVAPHTDMLSPSARCARVVYRDGAWIGQSSSDRIVWRDDAGIVVRGGAAGFPGPGNVNRPSNPTKPTVTR